MEDELLLNNCRLFALYAGDRLDVWRQIEGQQVTDKKGETGTITRVEPAPSSGDIRLYVRYANAHSDEAERVFAPVSFDRFFVDVTLPPDLEGIEAVREQALKQQQEEARQRKLAEHAAKLEEEKQKEAQRQREREAASAAHFAELKSKYMVDEYSASSPSSPSYAILLLLEDDEDLDDRHIDWLESEELFQVIAVYYEKVAGRNGDPWNIIKASKYWRKAGKPNRAVIITEGIESTDPKVMAAILTTRGGAFRDCKNLVEAERCARRAIEFAPESYHPYNLLGAISYQLGNPQKGDEYFAKAVELGAPPEVQDASIKKSVRDAEEILREELARYLLRKDPRRYSWAQYYLK